MSFLLTSSLCWKAQKNLNRAKRKKSLRKLLWLYTVWNFKGKRHFQWPYFVPPSILRRKKDLEFHTEHNYYVWVIFLLVIRVSKAERNFYPLAKSSTKHCFPEKRILLSRKSVILIMCFYVVSGILLHKLSEQHTLECHQPP